MQNLVGLTLVAMATTFELGAESKVFVHAFADVGPIFIITV